MAKSEMEKKIIELQEIIKKQDNQIAYLENLNKAYKNLSDLYNKELVEAERMLEAQEIIQNLMREEKIEADRMIKAHECLEELTVIEKKETVKLLEAQEKVSELSMKELREKDEILQKILSINKDIGSILNPAILLNKIVKSLMKSIGAEHGMLFIHEKNKLIPKIFINFDNMEMKKEYFQYCQQIILECANTKKSVLKVNEKLKNEDIEINISSIAVPMICKESLQGVLYADIVSESETFKASDLFSSEIFAGQAAISLNNAILYESIKKQNRELLRLINIKSAFIDRLSTHLSKPIKEAINILSMMNLQKGIPEEERSKMIRNTIEKLEKALNLTHKALSIAELETSAAELFKDVINVKEFIENSILKTHLKEIQEKGLKISVELPPDFEKFSANKSILRVILDELLSNAIFYNKPNGSVVVRGEVSNNMYKIEIMDTGYGIKPEDLDKIFQQFNRTEDSLKLNPNGAGLGLFMVKNSLNYYGGSINVESVYGEGSKFTVTFLVH